MLSKNTLSAVLTVVVLATGTVPAFTMEASATATGGEPGIGYVV